MNYGREGRYEDYLFLHGHTVDGKYVVDGKPLTRVFYGDDGLPVMWVLNGSYVFEEQYIIHQRQQILESI
jgi:hypothetical protein